MAATVSVFRFDAYSFWQPPDQKFMALMLKLTREERIGLVSFFWSSEFSPTSIIRPRWTGAATPISRFWAKNSLPGCRLEIDLCRRAALIMNDKECSHMFAGESGVTISPVRITHLLLVSLALFTAGCGKSPEEQKAAKAAEIAQTTGSLLVKSNRAEATVEASLLSATGAPATARQGTVNQPLAGLPPGQYAVVVRSEGWPELSGAVQVAIGQTTEAAMNFKFGSLRLDSVPNGAKVKHGGVLVGETPVLIPELPVGECELSLEYQSWPALPFKTTITEGTESVATARLPHGRLTVESVPPGAAVRLNGTQLGRTPLLLEEFPAGPKRLVLQAENFPTVAVSFTLEDGADLKLRPEMGSVFPLLDPVELLGSVWVPDDPNKIAPTFDSVGRYEPKNGIVKNLHRRKLFENWLGKTYRFAGTVKSFDPRDGVIEFTEQSSELSKYRIVAKLSPGALNAKNQAAPSLKVATQSVYGQLTAVEEPRWPSKVITLELTLAELLQGGSAAAP